MPVMQEVPERWTGRQHAGGSRSRRTASPMSSQLPNQPTTRNKVFLNPLAHTKGLAEIILVQWFSMQCNCKGSVKKKGSQGGSKICRGVEKVESHCPRGPTLSTHFISAFYSSSQTPANQVSLEECGTFRFSDQHQHRLKPLAGQLKLSVSTQSMEVCDYEVHRCPNSHLQTFHVKCLNKLDKLGSFKELKSSSEHNVLTGDPTTSSTTSTRPSRRRTLTYTSASTTVNRPV